MSIIEQLERRKTFEESYDDVIKEYYPMWVCDRDISIYEPNTWILVDGVKPPKYPQSFTLLNLFLLGLSLLLTGNVIISIYLLCVL